MASSSSSFASSELPLEFCLEVAIHRLEFTLAPLPEPSVSFKYAAFPEQTIYPAPIAAAAAASVPVPHASAVSRLPPSPAARIAAGLFRAASPSPQHHQKQQHSQVPKNIGNAFFDADRGAHVHLFASGKKATVFLTQRELQLNSLIRVNVQSRHVTVASLMLPLIVYNSAGGCNYPDYEPGRQGYNFSDNSSSSIGAGTVCGDFVLRATRIVAAAPQQQQQQVNHVGVPPLLPSIPDFFNNNNNNNNNISSSGGVVMPAASASRAQSRMDGDLPAMIPSTSFSEMMPVAVGAAAAVAAGTSTPLSAVQEEVQHRSEALATRQEAAAIASVAEQAGEEPQKYFEQRQPVANSDAAAVSISMLSSAPMQPASAASVAVAAAAAPTNDKAKMTCSSSSSTQTISSGEITSGSAAIASTKGDSNNNAPIVVKVTLPPAAAKKYLAAREADERRRKALPSEPDVHPVVVSKFLVKLKEILEVACFALSAPAVTIAPLSRIVPSDAVNKLVAAVQTVNRQISVLLTCEVSAVLGHGVDEPILCRLNFAPPHQSIKTSALPANATPPGLPTRPGPETVGRLLFDEVLAPSRALFVLCVAYGRVLTREGVARAVALVERASVDFQNVVFAINRTLELALSPASATAAAASSNELAYANEFSSSSSSSSSSSVSSSSSSEGIAPAKPITTQQPAPPVVVAAPPPVAPPPPPPPPPPPLFAVSQQQAPLSEPPPAAAFSEPPRVFGVQPLPESAARIAAAAFAP